MNTTKQSEILEQALRKVENSTLKKINKGILISFSALMSAGLLKSATELTIKSSGDKVTMIACAAGSITCFACGLMVGKKLILENLFDFYDKKHKISCKIEEIKNRNNDYSRT